MKRYLCWLALFGVLAVPDWASACRPLFGRWVPRPVYASPVQCVPAYPIYHPPVYAYPPAYPAPARPVPQPLQPPRVEATPSPAPAPKGEGMGVGNPGAAKPPAAEVVRPAAGSDATPASPPKNPEPKKADAAKVDPPKPEQKSAAPDLLPKFPEVEIPKDIGPLPKLELPKDPDFRAAPAPKGTPDAPKKPAANPEPAPAPDLSPRPPSVDVPKSGEPKLPKLEIPGSAATPAPAPDFPEPLIPSPSVPVIPDPAKPESLPALTLPPDVPLKKESTSKSSPVAAGPSVNVFPVAAAERPAGVYRTVGFYNHTARDLSLTIEGRAVKLPAKTYLHAQLARTFTWGHGDRPATRETVPDDSAGMDVVFRD
ncbi:MAG TPA: hypothetical protein VM529_04295 [Gemmata sp.]|nr:hypothetical protein [Gemmata sp.]